MSTESSTPESAEALAYDFASVKQSQQRDSISEIDGKIGTVATFASGLLAAFGIIFPLASHRETHEHALALVILFGLGIVVYLVTLWLLYQAYRPRHNWDWRPQLGAMLEHVETFNLPTLQLWAANEYCKAIDGNRDAIKQKADNLNRAMMTAGIETLVIAATGFVVFVLR